MASTGLRSQGGQVFPCPAPGRLANCEVERGAPPPYGQMSPRRAHVR